MALQTLVYLLKMLALQSVWVLHCLSGVVSERPDEQVIPGVLTQWSWREAIHKTDMQKQEARRRAPHFMMELYEEKLRDPKVLQGNIVRSYTGHTDGALHFFNLTSFDHQEKIIRADFRWFPHTRLLLPGHRFYRVSLYEMFENGVQPRRENLITSKLLPEYTRTWEVFNITQTVTNWILNNRTINGIMVISTSLTGHGLEDLPAEGATGSEENHTYLVIYSDQKGSGLNTDSTLKLFKHKSSLQKLVRRRRSKSEMLHGNKPSTTCQRTPLFVDFAKLGWSGWIISPKGYNAYHCTGSCPFPIGGNFQATNHAIVQSIVNMLKISDQVGKPCCVPDDLYPISLLYFDDEENVVLKQYDDMVAGSCGCH